MESDEPGEGAGGVGGELLEGEVDERVIDAGDGIDEEEQAKREDGGAKKARTAEEQGSADAVEKEDRPGVHEAEAVGVKDDVEVGEADDAGERDGDEHEKQRPGPAVELPLQAPPGEENAEERDDGKGSADGAERIVRPHGCKVQPQGQKREAGDDGDGGSDGCVKNGPVLSRAVYENR